MQKRDGKVKQVDGLVPNAAFAFAPEITQDERHGEDLSVQRERMEPAAMVGQLLAVVRRDRDDGVLEEPPNGECREKLAEGRIDRCDLGIVEVDEAVAIDFGGAAGSERNQLVVGGADGRREVAPEGQPLPLRGRVRRVGLHVVHVEEDGTFVAARKRRENLPIHLGCLPRSKTHVGAAGPDGEKGIGRIRLDPHSGGDPRVEAPREAGLLVDVDEVRRDPDGGIPAGA